MDNSNIKTSFYGADADRYSPYLGRYIVFACQTYYPSGGQGDVIGSVDTLEDVADLFYDSREPGQSEWFDMEVINGGRVQQIDVFDMEERRFIDIDLIKFRPKLI